MRKLALSLTFVVCLAMPVLAEGAQPFSAAKDIDLITLLSPPPAIDSPQLKA